VAALATIGVYGFDADSFLAALRAADVALLMDVRQRRGVRGSEYSWANARRLIAMLADATIDYRHELTLAPTTELRQLQYREDDRLRVGKRSRALLADAYRERYTREILDRADLDAIGAELAPAGTTVLLCVERDPAACHRSIAAERIAGHFGLALTHLLPAA
jgi:uncharacterized protein (DUF488 family)